MRIFLAIAAALLVSCVDVPPEVPRTACRALAVDKANRDADVMCDGYSWDMCPFAREIENNLMHDLEKCDGE